MASRRGRPKIDRLGIVPKLLRFAPGDITILESLAEQWGVSQAEVVRRLLQEAHSGRSEPRAPVQKEPAQIASPPPVGSPASAFTYSWRDLVHVLDTDEHHARDAAKAGRFDPASLASVVRFYGERIAAGHTMPVEQRGPPREIAHQTPNRDDLPPF